MRFVFLVFSLTIMILCGGCNYYMPNPECPPPPSARVPNTSTYSCTNPTVAPVIPDACEVLPLADLIDIGLQNSPKTRVVWYQAKQAAADVGIARGAYLPPIHFRAHWLRDQYPEVDLQLEVLSRFKTKGATLSTTYLLFDFGGRNGRLMTALAALDALGWYYNWEVQTVMINVIQSYYDYINAVDIVFADEATVEDNLTTLKAATARVKAGVVQLSDELQAATSLVQSQIVLEEDRAILNIARATLIQSLGLPADTPICVSELPEEISVDGVCEDVAQLMQIAKENRANLWAQRSAVQARYFRIRSARSRLLPTIHTELIGGKESINDLKLVDRYKVEFRLDLPLFNSFADINELRRTQAALLESQAILDDEELSAFLAVVSDYYELIANRQILKYSYKYLDIAIENREVAFANYKAGVTTIIDLMFANNALNIARKQLIDAKTNFLTSLANLAYDTGCLTVEDILSVERECSYEEVAQ